MITDSEFFIAYPERKYRVRPVTDAERDEKLSALPPGQDWYTVVRRADDGLERVRFFAPCVGSCNCSDAFAENVFLRMHQLYRNGYQPGFVP